MALMITLSLSAWADDSTLFKCKASDQSDIQVVELEISNEVAKANIKIQHVDDSTVTGVMKYQILKKEYLLSSEDSKQDLPAIHIKKYGGSWNAVLLSESPEVLKCNKK